MKYIIAKWNQDKLTWEIVHWSHMWDDAQDQYDLVKEKYDKVVLLVNHDVLKDQIVKDEVNKFFQCIIDGIKNAHLPSN